MLVASISQSKEANVHTGADPWHENKGNNTEEKSLSMPPSLIKDGLADDYNPLRRPSSPRKTSKRITKIELT